eukprot:scaffold12556_cov44-Cyclotella_meneghiniana.AAC.2
MLECISVTLNPMRLNGHLHIFSVVECSTRKARCMFVEDGVKTRFVVTIAVGMADYIGWGRPRRPPCLMDMVAISCEC